MEQDGKCYITVNRYMELLVSIVSVLEIFFKLSYLSNRRSFFIFPMFQLRKFFELIKFFFGFNFLRFFQSFWMFHTLAIARILKESSKTFNLPNVLNLSNLWKSSNPRTFESLLSNLSPSLSNSILQKFLTIKNRV